MKRSELIDLLNKIDITDNADPDIVIASVGLKRLDIEKVLPGIRHVVVDSAPADCIVLRDW